MGHLTEDRQFQSDKVPGMPLNWVPLNLTKKKLWPAAILLAESYRESDPEFTEILLAALEAVGAFKSPLAVAVVHPGYPEEDPGLVQISVVPYHHVNKVWTRGLKRSSPCSWKGTEKGSWTDDFGDNDPLCDALSDVAGSLIELARQTSD